MDNNTEWKCMKCGERLVPRKVVFDYMGRSFSEDFPCCPKCGLVLVPPEMAEGRMADVEQMLEDK